MSYTREQLISMLEEGKSVYMFGAVFTGAYYEKLSFLIKSIMDIYNKTDISPIVVAVTQEIALHASLDNYFAVFLQSQGEDWTTPVDWSSREKEFESDLNLQTLPDYRRVAKNIGLFLNIEIHHSSQGIRIEVKNNSHVSEDREQRIRFYMKQAMSYSNIMEYYNDFPEDQDGRKIGLALSILMLKEIHARPELLRMGGKVGERTSRLEVPFDDNFKSIRDRILNDEDIVPFENVDIYQGSSAMKILVKSKCPVCYKLVDDRLFFPIPPMDLIDHDKLLQTHPNWNPELGICAECIASFSLPSNI